MRRVALGSLGIGAVFFLIDRFLKLWFAAQPEFRLSVIEPVLRFEYAENSGIAFGLPLGGPILLLLSVIILVALVGAINYAYRSGQPFRVVALISIMIGAASNLIDRIRFGFVIDYINVPFFTIFNLADVMITVGVVTLGLELLRQQKPKT